MTFPNGYWPVGGTTMDVNVLAIKGIDANQASTIIFDGETSGGSTLTEIWLADPYDASKIAAYVGNYLVIPGAAGISARISAYTNRGSGAASVTVEAGKFSIAPDPGARVQIVRAAGAVIRQIAVTQRNIEVRD